MQTEFQLGSCIHVCTNETHSLANLQDLISTLAGLCLGLDLIYLLEFNLCCMDVTTQLELYSHEQTQIVANVACTVGSQQFLARKLTTCFLNFYYDPSFLNFL